MLPEPTVPKRRRAAPAEPQPGTMTPLFAVPDNAELPPPGPSVRAPGRGKAAQRSNRAAPSRSRKEPADLVTVTAERLRRALARSFLRYGVAGDPEAAVHAAMNVIEPVLDARDSEILRLRRLMAPKRPGRPGPL
jgi:hypothetical protein